MTGSDQYQELHRRREVFGSSDGGPHLPFLLAAVASSGARRLIDFGCGKGVAVARLAQLGLEVEGHDPYVDEFATVPEGRFDLLFSFDVLEHVPMSEMDEVLATCARLADTSILVPHLGLASTTLPNGENAHCTILPPHEWVAVIGRHYRHVTPVPHVSNKHVIVVASQEPQGHIVAACDAMRLGFSGLPAGLKARLRLARRLVLSREMQQVLTRAVVRRLPIPGTRTA